MLAPPHQVGPLEETETLEEEAVVKCLQMTTVDLEGLALEASPLTQALQTDYALAHLQATL